MAQVSSNIAVPNMVASAIAMPERDTSPSSSPTSPTLKRKLSDTGSPETKRPRLKSDDNSIQDQPTDTAPPRRQLPTAQEEKKRTQRLFSSLLGTLSQRSTPKNSSASASKRAEIEQRQRERLRKDTEEREAEDRRRKARLLEKRREEQKRWDAQGREVRWKNERFMAGFLRTKTEPILFWKPWELRSEEQECLDRQKEDVEARIERERKAPGLEGENATGGDDETGAIARQDVGGRGSDSGGQQAELQNPPEDGLEAQRPPSHIAGDDQPPIPNADDDVAGPTEKIQSSRPDVKDRDTEDDHHGGELVEGEGQEDDILY